MLQLLSSCVTQNSVCVLGHVDAGKSTLMGHLLYQLGFVGKKAMHKFEQDSRKAGKGSFAYAWVLDETEEERWLLGPFMRIYSCVCISQYLDPDTGYCLTM